MIDINYFETGEDEKLYLKNTYLHYNKKEKNKKQKN